MPRTWVLAGAGTFWNAGFACMCADTASNCARTHAQGCLDCIQPYSQGVAKLGSVTGPLRLTGRPGSHGPACDRPARACCAHCRLGGPGAGVCACVLACVYACAGLFYVGRALTGDEIVGQGLILSRAAAPSAADQPACQRARLWLHQGSWCSRRDGQDFSSQRLAGMSPEDCTYLDRGDGLPSCVAAI